jgi:hypothetical protein
MILDVYLQMHVDTGGTKPHRVVLYEANITHNLMNMADKSGLYKLLWRPEELGIKTGADLIHHLRDGIKRLESAPAYYSQFDSESGWGTYNQFLPFLRVLLVACVQHPKAEYYACR